MPASLRGDRPANVPASVPRASASPQLTIRSGWMRISGVGIAIASAAPADLDPARPPRVRAREVVDHDRGPPGPGHVAELLGQLELVAADVDRLADGVVEERDRDDVRRAVRADGREPAQLPPTDEIRAARPR